MARIEFSDIICQHLVDRFQIGGQRFEMALDNFDIAATGWTSHRIDRRRRFKFVESGLQERVHKAQIKPGIAQKPVGVGPHKIGEIACEDSSHMYRFPFGRIDGTRFTGNLSGERSQKVRGGLVAPFYQHRHTAKIHRYTASESLERIKHSTATFTGQCIKRHTARGVRPHSGEIGSIVGHSGYSIIAHSNQIEIAIGKQT